MADSTKPEHADVVVIGSGASGALTSLVLGEAGLKVVCLEQGGWTAPEDHPHFAADWEWQRQIRWSPNNNHRAASSDYPVESATSNILMWNAVGGSTNIYTALWPRYRPSDFRKGTEHGLAPDWPIAYEDLAPSYDADRSASSARAVWRATWLCRLGRTIRPRRCRFARSAVGWRRASIGSAGTGGRCRRASSPRTTMAARRAPAAADASAAARSAP